MTFRESMENDGPSNGNGRRLPETMPSGEAEPATPAEALFRFAIDREDTKWLLSQLPKTATVKPVALEYELQILKIITVGWSISYFLAEDPLKDDLSGEFWKSMFSFSQTLSETTELMIGQNIDYFQTLRERLDRYVNAMNERPDASDPASVVGPVFARACGVPDDVFTVLIGSRMFVSTLQRTRDYLENLPSFTS